MGDIFAQHDFLSAPVEDAAGDRTRPNLKIQDGCNNRCSFCIIPFVRGRSRSAPADQVVEQVRDLGGALSRSGAERHQSGPLGTRAGQSRMRLADLIRRLLDETAIERLRLSSVEPMDLSRRSARPDGVVAAHRQARACAVAVGLGSRAAPDASQVPAAALCGPHPEGARLDAGCGHRRRCHGRLPGETDAEFEETRAFIERLPFTYLHVFTYSERPGTPAAARPSRSRWRCATNATGFCGSWPREKNLEFRRRMVGRTLSVVTLRGGALTDNFLRVELATGRERNQLMDVKIGSLTPAGCANTTY